MYSNITGIPRAVKDIAKPQEQVKESDFEEKLREDFANSDNEIVEKSKSAKVVKVEDPFKEPVVKKTTSKGKTKTKAKTGKKK